MKVLLTSMAVQRLLVGLMQGMALFGLTLCASDGGWLASRSLLLAPLWLVALYVPVVALVGLGRLTARQLARWIAIVTLVLIGLALHDINRRLGAPQDGLIGGPEGLWLPSFPLIIQVAAALFIAHSLVVAAVVDGKAIARYPTYFDVAWKHGVQLALGGVFVGVFWIVLELGSAMFSMLNLNQFAHIISKAWFYWPATFLALAAAIHLTDVAPGVISGIRKVTLTLMAWLLPILVLIVAGFLTALAATSLQLLWDTGHGAQFLLLSAAGLVLFANASYQQGPPRPDAEGYLPPRLLVWSAITVGPMAVILVGLASYATFLRVADYGWTADRVTLAVIDGVAAVYAVGYMLAGRWKSTPCRPWELTNVVAALVTVLVILALQSPIADPARIAVASQVARLRQGVVTAEKFDFAALRFDGQRYGQEALAVLSQDTDLTIQDAAVAALVRTNRWREDQNSLPPLSTDAILANLVSHPDGRVVPPALAALELPEYMAFAGLECFELRHRTCDVVFLEKAADSAQIAVIFDTVKLGLGIVAREDEAGHWSAVATLRTGCKEVREALIEGTYALIPPAMPDIEIGGQRLMPDRVDDFQCSQ